MFKAWRSNLFRESFSTTHAAETLHSHVGGLVLELEVVAEDEADEDVDDFSLVLAARRVLDVLQQVDDEVVAELIEVVHRHLS